MVIADVAPVKHDTRSEFTPFIQAMRGLNLTPGNPKNHLQHLTRSDLEEGLKQAVTVWHLLSWAGATHTDVCAVGRCAALSALQRHHTEQAMGVGNGLGYDQYKASPQLQLTCPRCH